jgi:(1->4)-alpha-D-glucan 1-alpha-D-glucosylmutase
MTFPAATYRLQLRGGVTFSTVERHLPYIAGLGVSFLYLSPIFSAASGSSHGYDTIDVTRIDPGLGGRAGFSRLAAAARQAGLGLVLDWVPNHTAFSVENPWLRDVLRLGERSRFARHFDIDWSRGRLVLPFLPEPFETMLSNGAFGIAEEDGEAVMTAGELSVPLAPGALPPGAERGDPDALRALHDAQSWRLTHWEFERDGVTHRRFFNVTGLIGMRVEDARVFDDVHRTLLELVRTREVQGLRLDHIDGLADPAGYLKRLRTAVGPDVPIWVEKILTGDEMLPEWPVEGTTGYEAARAIAAVLTQPPGIERIDAAWREQTGRQGSFHEALAVAKDEVMRHELAAELHALIDLARAAGQSDGELERGDEALREAILALLIAFPRYRTYFVRGQPPPSPDLRLMQAVVSEATAGLRDETALRFVARLVTDPATDEEEAFRTRFQQVTGALLAKAHEDTAGFRYNRYLAANEVGADPDDPALGVAAFSDWIGARGAWGLTLASSHDTKRSADARMRLVAISHRPEAFLELWHDSLAVPHHEAVDPNLRWYVVQSLFAIWEPGRDDLVERIADHTLKAMREAKEATTWTHPDAAAEDNATGFARALARRWEAGLPSAGVELLAAGDMLSLAQVALQMTIPGIPDLYQGDEGPARHLTDPDNRRAVDFGSLASLAEEGGPAGRKARLTRTLLSLRRARPDFFAQATARAEPVGSGGLRLVREHLRFRLTVSINDSAAPAPDQVLWPRDPRDVEAAVAVSWHPGGTELRD